MTCLIFWEACSIFSYGSWNHAFASAHKAPKKHAEKLIASCGNWETPLSEPLALSEQVESRLEKRWLQISCMLSEPYVIRTSLLILLVVARHCSGVPENLDSKCVGTIRKSQLLQPIQ